MRQEHARDVFADALLDMRRDMAREEADAPDAGMRPLSIEQEYNFFGTGDTRRLLLTTDAITMDFNILKQSTVQWVHLFTCHYTT